MHVPQITQIRKYGDSVDCLQIHTQLSGDAPNPPFYLFSERLGCRIMMREDPIHSINVYPAFHLEEESVRLQQSVDPPEFIDHLENYLWKTFNPRNSTKCVNLLLRFDSPGFPPETHRICC